MASFLRNKNKVNSVTLHPVAQTIVTIIETLNFTFYIDALDQDGLLHNLMKSPIRLEGILDHKQNFLVFSPLFDLRILQKPLHEHLQTDPIVYKVNELSEIDIKDRIWGDFFKQLFTSIDSKKDVAKIQQNLNEHLPEELCKAFFNKKNLNDHAMGLLTHQTRSAIFRQREKLKKEKRKKETSDEIFTPTTPSLAEGAMQGELF